jgi:hypothetical protein
MKVKKPVGTERHEPFGLLDQFPGIMTLGRYVGLSRHLAADNNVDIDTS